MFVLFKKWINQSHLPVVKVFNALMLALAMNFVFGLGFYLAESGYHDGLTLADSIWWSMVTMTTVGYGDIYPVTFVGRFLIAYPCFLIGIGFIGFLFGIVVDSVLEQVTKKKKGYAKVHLKDHYIICNVPGVKKILQIVEELRESPENKHLHVVVVDASLSEQPNEFKERQIHFVKGESSSEEVLKRAGIDHCIGVLVLAKDLLDEGADADTFASGTVVKMLLKKRDKGDVSSCRVVLELVNRENRHLLEKVKADGIVVTEGISENLLVQELCNPGLSDIFDQLISFQFGSEFYLVKSKLTGHSLREVQIAAISHDEPVQVLGLVRDGKTFFDSSKDTVIESSDHLILLANSVENYDVLERFLLASDD